MEDLGRFQMLICLIGVLVLVPITIMFFVYLDAKNNGISYPEIWSVLTILLPFAGLIIYMIVRTGQTTSLKEIKEGIENLKESKSLKSGLHTNIKERKSGPIERYK